MKGPGRRDETAAGPRPAVETICFRMEVVRERKEGRRCYPRMVLIPQRPKTQPQVKLFSRKELRITSGECRRSKTGTRGRLT